jgi:hypothetical protein
MIRAFLWTGFIALALGLLGGVLGWRSSVNWTFLAIGAALWLTAIVTSRTGRKPPIA